MTSAAVLVAAGSGRRMGSPSGARPKQMLPLAGKPLIAYSIDVFSAMEEIQALCIVTQPEWRKEIEALDAIRTLRKPLYWATGGDRRQDSARNGLRALPADTSLVAIHDAARPFPPPQAIAKALQYARKHGGAILAMPVTDTIKKMGNDGVIADTVDRSSLWAAQTPQVFQRDLLMRAYAYADEKGIDVTDDASACEALGHSIGIIPGSRFNLKVTTPEDLILAEAIAQTSQDAAAPHRLS